MNRRPGSERDAGVAGMTLVEMTIALVVIAVGIMAIARLFPADSRSQLAGRMQTTAGEYANDQFEKLRGVTKTSASLSAGRHPVAGFDSLGTKKSLQRYYLVSQMAAPLDSLLKIDVTVRWQSSKAESLRLSGYLFP